MKDRGVHYLYRHIRLDSNEPFYIGIGTVYEKYINSTGYVRYYSRAFTKSKRSAHWKNVTNLTKYDVEILFESNDYEVIKQKEKEFITLYGRADLKGGTLVNHTDGGEGSKNRITSSETRKKQSSAHKGENNSFYGKVHSKETKEKQRAIKLGKKAAETTLKKLREARVGGKNPKAKKIIDISTNITYDCLKDACKELSISYNTARDYLQNKYPNKSNLRCLKEYNNE